MVVVLVWLGVLACTPNELPPPKILAADVEAAPKLVDENKPPPTTALVVLGIDLLAGSEILREDMKPVPVKLAVVGAALNGDDAKSPDGTLLTADTAVLVTEVDTGDDRVATGRTEDSTLDTWLGSDEANALGGDTFVVVLGAEIIPGLPKTTELGPVEVVPNIPVVAD